MSNSEDQDAPKGAADAPQQKSSKQKPVKSLPTDRVSFEKQLSILRAYAAASGPDRKAVSIAEVANIVGIHPGSVSNCNPFFADISLLAREGTLYRPIEAVIDYASSYEWDQAAAAHKLVSAFSESWFAKALVPKLSFRALSKDEAVKFLADECKAPPDYKDQLLMLVDYLSVAGIVSVEGNSVSKGTNFRGLPRDVKPAMETEPATSKTPPQSATPTLHPFIDGLLKTLPTPSEKWTLHARAKWLQAAANIFDLIYVADESDETKSLKVELAVSNEAKGGTK